MRDGHYDDRNYARIAEPYWCHGLEKERAHLDGDAAPLMSGDATLTYEAAFTHGIQRTYTVDVVPERSLLGLFGLGGMTMMRRVRADTERYSRRCSDRVRSCARCCA